MPADRNRVQQYLASQNEPSASGLDVGLFIRGIADPSTPEDDVRRNYEERIAAGETDDQIGQSYVGAGQKELARSYTQQRTEAMKRYTDQNQRNAAMAQAESGTQKVARILADMANAYAGGKPGEITATLRKYRDAERARADKLAGDTLAFELEGIEGERTDQYRRDTLTSMENRARAAAEAAEKRAKEKNETSLQAAGRIADGANWRNAEDNATKIKVAQINQSGATDRAKLPKPPKAGTTAAPKPGAAQVALDKKVGAALGEWLDTGQATVGSNIATLEGVRDQLLDPNGPDQSGIWEGVKSNLPFTDANSRKDTVRAVVQGSLRPTIGAAFTEREGEGVMNRAYNPYADERENAMRLERTVRLLRELAKAKDAQVEWLNDPNNHGSMAGYTGPDMMRLIEQFKRELPEAGGPSKSSAPPKRGAPRADGKIQVTNGRESLWIDPADEKDAAIDGFRRAQ